ncbi:hypothetical protein GCM10010123_42900 [Pilimelia anulata]|uniref:DUF881 domain-containing protein n=1 Tax=Pilimelia anulata TaxID=53371 RepID=A0A8J3BAU9_9ACTN|nr:DUF881 domain-containing protein [Pilimelia anulata]GGK08387.1 hypothetical protein GCM10010123_42900 [Pilimelia anulata]
MTATPPSAGPPEPRPAGSTPPADTPDPRPAAYPDPDVARAADPAPSTDPRPGAARPADARPGGDAAARPGAGGGHGAGHPRGGAHAASARLAAAAARARRAAARLARTAAAGWPATRPADGGTERPAKRRLSGAGAAIAVLLALLGFGLVAQLRNVANDQSLDTAREDDLVRILSDLEAREQRLSTDVRRLEESERQLGSGAQRREAALADASRRANALGILAGTLPAEGSGMHVRLSGNPDQVSARTLLDTVQELRNSGAEVMQLSGANADPLRVVASSYFIDADGGVKVDGKALTGPYTIDVVGDATIMQSALTIFGGVVETVSEAGGSVTMEPAAVVKVTARYSGFNLQYARPAS